MRRSSSRWHGVSTFVTVNGDSDVRSLSHQRGDKNGRAVDRRKIAGAGLPVWGP